MKGIDKFIAGFLIQRDELRKPNRKTDVVHKRWYLCVFFHERGYTLQQIGDVLNQHHASVISGIKKYKALISVSDKKLLEDTSEYRQYLEHLPLPKYDMIDDILKATGRNDLDKIKRRIKLGLY